MVCKNRINNWYLYRVNFCPISTNKWLCIFRKIFWIGFFDILGKKSLLEYHYD